MIIGTLPQPPVRYSLALIRLRIRKDSGPRITDDMLTLSDLARINIAKVRPEPLGQLAEPGRLVAEFDHVQNERIDPRGLVHDGLGNKCEVNKR